MATRPVTGEPGWGTTYDSYEEVSHNTDGTLKAIEGGAPTSVDAAAATLVKDVVYKTQTSGFVTAWCENHSATPTHGLMGATDQVGTLVAWNDSAGTQGSDEIAAFVMFFVPKDFYFKVSNDTGMVVMWTPLVPSGGAPISQA